MTRHKPPPGNVARNWQPPAPPSEFATRQRDVRKAIQHAGDKLLGCAEIARATGYTMDEVYRALQTLTDGREIEKVHTRIATRYGSRVLYQVKEKARGD